MQTFRKNLFLSYKTFLRVHMIATMKTLFCACWWSFNLFNNWPLFGVQVEKSRLILYKKLAHIWGTMQSVTLILWVKVFEWLYPSTAAVDCVSVRHYSIQREEERIWETFMYLKYHSTLHEAITSNNITTYAKVYLACWYICEGQLEGLASKIDKCKVYIQPDPARK